MSKTHLSERDKAVGRARIERLKRELIALRESGELATEKGVTKLAAIMQQREELEDWAGESDSDHRVAQRARLDKIKKLIKLVRG
jgi:hypothetical protein